MPADPDPRQSEGVWLGTAPQAGLLTGLHVAAALGHSLMAKPAGCLCSFNTLGSNASCRSYFWPCFGLQRREVGASVSLLSSLFEVKPNKRGPTLITSVLPFLGPPPQALDAPCTRPHVHTLGSCMPLNSGWVLAQENLGLSFCSTASWMYNPG